MKKPISGKTEPEKLKEALELLEDAVIEKLKNDVDVKDLGTISSIIARSIDSHRDLFRTRTLSQEESFYFNEEKLRLDKEKFKKEKEKDTEIQITFEEDILPYTE